MSQLQRKPETADEEWAVQLEAYKREAERRMEEHDARSEKEST